MAKNSFLELQKESWELEILWTFFKQEDDYFKPITGGNFWNDNYIEYENDGNQ